MRLIKKHKYKTPAGEVAGPRTVNVLTCPPLNLVRLQARPIREGADDYKKWPSHFAKLESV